MSVNRLVSFGFAAFLAVAGAGWLNAGQSTDSPVPSPSTEKPGVCERLATKLTGREAWRIGKTIKPPKKIRNVSPNYPEWPPGTTGQGLWIGEALIDTRGQVLRVWPIREVQITPPLPAFNQAIVDAIRRWEFEPAVVDKREVPVCMTVTVNINWQ